MNLDADGMLWVCAQQWEQGGRHVAYRGRYRMGDKTVHFLDNSVAQIDPSDGRVREVISMADILRENDLGHLVLRSGDPQDPLHLNDVEPALHRSRHFEEGDLFLTSATFKPCSNTGRQPVKLYEPSRAPCRATRRGHPERLDPGHLQQRDAGDFGRYTSKKDKYPISKDQASGSMALGTGPFQPPHGRLHLPVPSSDGPGRHHDLHRRAPGHASKRGRFVEEQNSGVLWVLNEDGCFTRTSWRAITLATIISPTGPAL